MKRMKYRIKSLYYNKMDEFRAEIIQNIISTPHMRNEVTVIPLKRDVMNIPTLVARPTVTWTEENGTKDTSTAHFNQKTLTVFKMASILYSSDELIEDSTEIDLVSFIVKMFSDVIAEEEDKVITYGNGTTQPLGYSYAGTGIVTTNLQGGTVDFDDIIDLEYALPKPYLPAAKYYINRTKIRDLRKLKDLDNRYLWSEPVAAGQPATFHGYPVFQDDNLASTKIFFGDLKKAYWLGDRKKMTVKISNDTETAFSQDKTAIRVVERIAGTVVLPDAMRGLTNLI